MTSAIDTTDLSDMDQERRSKDPVKIKKSHHGTKTSELRMPAAPPYRPVARHRPSPCHEVTAPSGEILSTTESLSICSMEQIQPRSSTPVTAEAVQTQQVNFSELFDEA